MDTKETKVQGMFDRIARRYDFLNRLMSLGLDTGWKKETAKNVSEKNSFVLDVACGTGDIALFSKNAGSRVVGLDFSMDMLRYARKKGPGIMWIKANAQTMPFQNEVFDGVASGYALRNFSDMGKALEEMNRVLKREGKISIIEFSHPKNPLWNLMYNIHIGIVVPLLGAIFSDRSSYSYLPGSIKKFPNQEGIKKIMEERGFFVSYKNLLFGVSAIWRGKKK